MLRARAEAMGDDTGEIELHPDEVNAVALFVSLRTQWNWHPTMGIRTGLNYAQIAPAAAGMAIEVTPDLWSDIRIMEAEALTAWARK